MKVLIYLAALSYCCIINVLSVTGGSLNSNGNALLPFGESECTTQYSCYNCTAIRLCNTNTEGKFVESAILNCSESTPYCDQESGTCTTAINDVLCAPNADQFICSQDGFFPDPLNCRNYYRCLRGKAYKFTCSVRYNSISESCDPTVATCSVLNCANKNGLKVSYTPNRSFYGYCVDNIVYRVDRCPGRFQLDDVQQTCVPVCDAEGNQPDPYDCTKYYNCAHLSSASTLSVTHVSCPKGEFFDAVNLHCTERTPQLTCAH